MLIFNILGLFHNFFLQIYEKKHRISSNSLEYVQACFLKRTNSPNSILYRIFFLENFLLIYKKPFCYKPTN